ncbi:hypothetical protein Tco_0862293 [Tanacetum coccineum]
MENNASTTLNINKLHVSIKDDWILNRLQGSAEYDRMNVKVPKLSLILYQMESCENDGAAFVVIGTADNVKTLVKDIKDGFDMLVHLGKPDMVSRTKMVDGLMKDYVLLEDRDKIFNYIASGTSGMGVKFPDKALDDVIDMVRRLDAFTKSVKVGGASKKPIIVSRLIKTIIEYWMVNLKWDLKQISIEKWTVKLIGGVGKSATKSLKNTTNDREKGLKLREFDWFVQNYNMHSLGKTVNELHAMLKLHEQTLNLPKNNSPALHAIRAGKVQKGKKHSKSQPQKAARGQIKGMGKISMLMLPSLIFPLQPRGKIPQRTQSVVSVVRQDIGRGTIIST